MGEREVQGRPDRHKVRELFRKSVVIAATSQHLTPEQSQILLDQIGDAYKRFEADCVAEDINRIVIGFEERAATREAPREPGAC